MSILLSRNVDLQDLLDYPRKWQVAQRSQLRTVALRAEPLRDSEGVKLKVLAHVQQWVAKVTKRNELRLLMEALCAALDCPAWCGKRLARMTQFHLTLRMLPPSQGHTLQSTASGHSERRYERWLDSSIIATSVQALDSPV
eukprot:6460083-Amphidinium_carterae.1